MRFAAGLTITGIVGFIITEALKLLMPTVTVWIIAMLTLALKILLIGLAIGFALAAIGVGIFFFRRAEKARGEA